MDASGLEIWGGLECTVCRIGDEYSDQTLRSGHHDRAADLDRIASLGITHLRYPVLWERVAPNGVERADWSWTDARLERLRELGITPIVTLLHHGSGPRSTNLLDPEFPHKFAEYAGAVARRYPWLRYFTPVNEPMTTARFSALYGWWYPHRSSEPEFYQALFHELRGTRLAMSAIRESIPGAALVGTEDLGKTYATPHLRYQAENENARRFLTYDLLCGRLDLNPDMRRYLEELGFRVDGSFERELTCIPDVLGYNYYVTGERWLDERLDRYPREYWGGNGRDRYADVEAVRACREGIAGAGALLWECWQRYGRTVAITEAHLACTREEQLRWLRDVHNDLTAVRERGADVRAMTIWSLLGAFDWNSALTRQDGYYESGAFDVSTGTPRETAIASYVRTLTGRDSREVPALDGAGWWRLPSRLRFEPSLRETHKDYAPPEASRAAQTRRPIVVLDGGDPAAQAIREACAARNLAVTVCAKGLAEEDLAALLASCGAWAALDCITVDEFTHFELAARACRAAGVRFAAVCKNAKIEEMVLRRCPDVLIVRYTLPFADDLLDALIDGERGVVLSANGAPQAQARAS